MYRIYEKLEVRKRLGYLPPQVLRKYNMWKALVTTSGPFVLRNFPGYHDEALKGQWEGCRSSRLNIQFRVIYSVNSAEEIVYVDAVTPHEY